jgi:NADP-dependent 3-hydroxy acid dehydrogenase YdfG
MTDIMPDVMLKQLPADPLGQDAVVLVVDADTDDGYRLAREFLCVGCRVAATALCAADLVRILHGYGAEKVLAVAADMHDDKQRQRVIARVERQFGRIDATVCARDLIAGFTESSGGDAI